MEFSVVNLVLGMLILLSVYTRGVGAWKFWQLKQIKKLGSLSGIMSMIPGVSGMMNKLEGMAPPEEELKKIEAIIHSMTKKERQDPEIINGNRRKRIAQGSGTNVSDVNKFLKSFDHMKKLMKHLPKSGFPDLRGMGNTNLR